MKFSTIVIHVNTIRLSCKGAACVNHSTGEKMQSFCFGGSNRQKAVDTRHCSHPLPGDDGEYDSMTRVSVCAGSSIETTSVSLIRIETRLRTVVLMNCRPTHAVTANVFTRSVKYTVRQKNRHRTLVHILAKYWPDQSHIDAVCSCCWSDSL